MCFILNLIELGCKIPDIDRITMASRTTIQPEFLHVFSPQTLWVINLTCGAHLANDTTDI